MTAATTATHKFAASAIHRPSADTQPRAARVRSAEGAAARRPLGRAAGSR
jgi:hypothetical protein